MSSWNEKVIAEFRANQGRVGGPFEGAPMVLLHHVGRRSGKEVVAPLVYLPGEDGTIYVFASKGGAPTNPEWYHNLVSAGRAEVEVGSERFPVAVEELHGEERDAVFAEQVRRSPGFGEYQEGLRGVRTIPVLALRRDR